MANKRLRRKAIAELLFWLHSVIVVAIAMSGLFLSWPWVIAILLALRAQQIIFHGCILTIYEIKEGGIPKGMVYYQIAAKRFFGYRLSRMGVHVVFMLQVVVTLLITVLATVKHIRL